MESRLERWPIWFGIGPERLFESRERTLRAERFPNVGGTTPVRLFPERPSPGRRIELTLWL